MQNIGDSKKMHIIAFWAGSELLFYAQAESTLHLGVWAIRAALRAGARNSCIWSNELRCHCQYNCGALGFWPYAFSFVHGRHLMFRALRSFCPGEIETRSAQNVKGGSTFFGCLLLGVYKSRGAPLTPIQQSFPKGPCFRCLRFWPAKPRAGMVSSGRSAARYIALLVGFSALTPHVSHHQD